MLIIPLWLAACGSNTATPDAAAGDDDSAAPVDTGQASAHVFTVGPLVQSVGPTDAWLVWETQDGEGASVEYGLTEALGVTAHGSTAGDALGSLHEVHLTGLEPDTTVWYAVQTGLTRSAPTHFRTAPARGTERSFQLVAVSDMQRDDAWPDKWQQIVQDSVLPFISDSYGEDLPESLGFVLLAGDLVDNGWNRDDWLDDFFPGAAPLMGQVPLYPVYGNHEARTPYLTRYFHLPDNGPDGYLEHTWSFDYANLRVIGLDSNEGFREQAQLDWLDQTLDAACTDDTLEFVFVELHHPWRSELWPAGELDYTGDVISRLETFTTACGKPSIHFFGHTHAYSRGQSQDHRHLWVNVATAGGAIDRWGGGDEVDYPWFTVSQARYGFVVIEVEPGAFTLRRISLGTPEDPEDDVVSDELRVTLEPTPPDTPVASAPVGGATISGDLTLQASAFSHPSGGSHGASQWQVSADCEGFSDPVVDTWVQHQDWFEGVDLQAGDDLTDEQIEGLPSGDWCWRVRYRDRALAWSEWSAAARCTVVPGVRRGDSLRP